MKPDNKQTIWDSLFREDNVQDLPTSQKTPFVSQNESLELDTELLVFDFPKFNSTLFDNVIPIEQEQKVQDAEANCNNELSVVPSASSISSRSNEFKHQFPITPRQLFPH